MTKIPDKIARVYQYSASTSKITQRVKWLAKANLIFLNCLPSELGSHCQLANIRGSTLVVHSDNAAISSLLRFQAPTLYQTLSEQLELTVNAIEIKVRTDYRYQPQTNNPLLPLPDSAASALEQVANSLEQGNLRNALLRLAQRRASSLSNN